MDHPRIHGEHQTFILWLHHKIGSPPHTRGTPLHVVNKNKLTRITPAYTGNTKRFEKTDYTVRDHPRIHGEHA